MANSTKLPTQFENNQPSQDETDWDNMTNAGANDAAYAENLFNSGHGALSSYLMCFDFEFNIPTSSTIDGISVSVERYRGTGDIIKDYSIKLFSAPSKNFIGNDKVGSPGLTWDTSPSVSTYGGPTDMWGTSLTASDINEINFGVGIQAEAEFSGYGSSEAYIDYVEMTVFYTEFSGGVKFGSSSIQKIFFGSTEINKVMFGSSQVF